MLRAVCTFMLWYLPYVGGFAQVTQQAPASPTNSSYERALDFYYHHQYAETIHLTQQMVAKAPDYYEAYLLRGMAREETGDLQGALTDYRITLHLHPDYQEALFRKALLLFHAEEYAAAIRDFEHLLSSHPSETQAVFFKGSNDRTGFSTEAITTLQSDMQADFYNYIGLAYLHQQDAPTAIRYLDSAIALQPEEADFRNNRGLAYEQTDDLPDAIQNYQQALRLDPEHPQALQNLATAAYKSGQEDLLEKTLNIAPGSAMRYLQRGILKQRQGNHREAIMAFDSALMLDPTVADHYLFRAFSEQKTGALQQAADDYTQALRLDPMLTQAYSNRGNVYFKRKEYRKAIEDYNQAIGLAPEQPSFYYNRGLAYHALHDKNACVDLERALDMGYQEARKPLNSFCQ